MNVVSLFTERLHPTKKRVESHKWYTNRCLFKTGTSGVKTGIIQSYFNPSRKLWKKKKKTTVMMAFISSILQ